MTLCFARSAFVVHGGVSMLSQSVGRDDFGCPRSPMLLGLSDMFLRWGLLFSVCFSLRIIHCALHADLLCNCSEFRCMVLTHSHALSPDRTQSLEYPPTHPLAHSPLTLSHSLARSATYSLTRSLTHSFTHPFTHSLTCTALTHCRCLLIIMAHCHINYSRVNGGTAVPPSHLVTTRSARPIRILLIVRGGSKTNDKSREQVKDPDALRKVRMRFCSHFPFGHPLVAFRPPLTTF